MSTMESFIKNTKRPVLCLIAVVSVILMFKFNAPPWAWAMAFYIVVMRELSTSAKSN